MAELVMYCQRMVVKAMVVMMVMVTLLMAAAVAQLIVEAEVVP